MTKWEKMLDERNLVSMEDAALTVLTTELKDIADLANEYAKRSMSKSTIYSYGSDWIDFKYWCESKKLPFIPASPSTVAGYMADRASNCWISKNGKKMNPLKVSTLERRLTTISIAHHKGCFPFDRKHPTIQATWKGIKNTHGVAQTRKDPILIEDLRKMIELIPIDDRSSYLYIEEDGRKINSFNEYWKPVLKGIRDRAILLIGFAGAFRRSELVALRMEDLKFTKEGIVVNLKRSKTDQIGEGRDIAIPYGSNPLTCPVRNLQDWLTSAKIDNGPLFRAINRHGQVAAKAISHRSVARMIKANPFLIGRSESFSGHSLRSGFATTAALAGVPEHEIMRQTGHKKSDTIKKYIRISSLWKENAASKIGL